MIERALSNSGLPGGTIHFDFDTGREIVENGVQDSERIRRDGRDAQFVLTAGQEKLIGLDLLTTGAGESFWSSAPATAVVDVLNYELSQRGLKPGTQISLTGPGVFPRAYMFRTREGTFGLLQIVGFTDNPRAVKIRYKLVQQPTTQPAAPATTQALPVAGAKEVAMSFLSALAESRMDDAAALTTDDYAQSHRDGWGKVREAMDLSAVQISQAWATDDRCCVITSRIVARDAQTTGFLGFIMKKDGARWRIWKGTQLSDEGIAGYVQQFRQSFSDAVQLR